MKLKEDINTVDGMNYIFNVKWKMNKIEMETDRCKKLLHIGQNKWGHSYEKNV